ncbi:MAG: malate synthase A [Myxococcota bacterium]
MEEARPIARSPGGLRIVAPIDEEVEVLFTDAASAFLAGLAEVFAPRVRELLARRRVRQAEHDAGRFPDFLPETQHIRELDWTVAPPPVDLLDRRVELTGPVDVKRVINGLNSGARVFMADFEDATTPTWGTLVRGQLNLMRAVRGTLAHEDPRTGKTYALAAKRATLVVRPRGWHLPERHLEHRGAPLPGALMDFGLYLFHNAWSLLNAGTGPYFYLPKLQGRLEARLWNDVFLWSQAELGLPRGTIRATVLVETLPAVFEMDEILWELREHSAGLNCGRWDYIFSFIKTFAEHPAFVLPDRDTITMEQDFLRAYASLVVRTCHRRGIHAMGGMAAQIPLPDPERNAAALQKVRADKLREVTLGHDGTWVAHPGLVPVALEIFDAHVPGPNQIHRREAGPPITREQLLKVPAGPRTELGLRHDVDVAVRYLASWLSGTGCVPIHGLMEDAATAEIARSQIWQWVRHRARLDDGRAVNPGLFRQVLADEQARLRAELGPAFDAGRYAEAGEMIERLCTSEVLPEFLTLPAYERILETYA